MNDRAWRITLQTCRRVLGVGAWDASLSDSWCAYTTFSSLEHGLHYWCCGFPNEDECLETSTVDGGLWRQEFMYSDLAHLVIPRSFYWESFANGNFCSGLKSQRLDVLSSELEKQSIAHRKTELVVEIKLY